MSNMATELELTDFIKDMVPPEERHSGYLVDLSTLSLAEGADGTATSWVHALSIGEFRHPFWGTLKFTADRIQRFATNVVNKVRGVDLAIDFSHRSEDEAAGWVQTAEARPDGLWLLVEWTKKAAEAIRNKEFRYFSADFADEWEDSDGKRHQDVLFGGGLTNRPFLKDLVPVNLSELQAKERKEKEDEPMKELLKALGLSEDATEEEAIEALKKLQEPAPTPPEPKPTSDELIKLAEDNPAIKALIDEVAELKTSARFSEAQRLVEGWSVHSTSKFALPEAIATKLTETIVSAPKALQEAISEVMDHILEHGLVKLGETGRKRTSDPDPQPTTSAASRFDAEVKKLMESDSKMSFADAVTQVSLNNEELYAEYRREAITGAVVEEVDD